LVGLVRLLRLVPLLLGKEFIHSLLQVSLAVRSGWLNRDASGHCFKPKSLGVTRSNDLNRIAFHALPSALATFNPFDFPVPFAGHRDRLVLVHDLSRAQHFLAAMSGVDRL